MVVVGLETSGMVGSVALLRNGEVLNERLLGQAGRRHAQSLVKELGDVLRQHHLKPLDVNAVAVSVGPGSFTGLRVGVVCAKTFAYATGCRFVAVDTLAAIAENAPQEVRRVWVVENAQRGELFAGLYVHQKQDEGNGAGSWRRETPVEVVCADEWLAARTGDDVVMGPGLATCDESSVRARLLVEETFARPKAAVIARLGWQKLVAQTDASPLVEFDFWKAVPFYIRPSAAEEKHDWPKEAKGTKEMPGRKII